MVLWFRRRSTCWSPTRSRRRVAPPPSSAPSPSSSTTTTTTSSSRNTETWWWRPAAVYESWSLHVWTLREPLTSGNRSDDKRNFHLTRSYWLRSVIFFKPSLLILNVNFKSARRQQILDIIWHSCHFPSLTLQPFIHLIFSCSFYQVTLKWCKMIKPVGMAALLKLIFLIKFI